MSSAAPNTIMLIHGLWMTPRSWENWISHYEQAGYTVLAPAYPGLEVEVEALREDPTPIEALTIESTVDHYATIIQELDTPPIIMGHSFGGAMVQLLLDRGLGSSGVAIHSVATKGVKVLPLAEIKAGWPVLSHPSNRHKAVGFTPKQFRYAFANVCTEEQSQAAYDRYHVPAPGRFVFDGALANFRPHAPTEVDYKKEDRAPLLFIAGGEDHLAPAAVNRSNAHHYKSGVVEFEEFPGRCHYTVGEDGWEEVADFALDWAKNPTKNVAAV
jgi:pimeloyl-ACP methyl ester carboxylesterase